MTDPSSSSSSSTAGSSADSAPSSSSSSSSSTSQPYYPLLSSQPHNDSNPPNSPIDPSSLATTLRDPPNPDIIPASRPTLTQFRQSEGPSARATKLRSLWDSLPDLPHLTDDNGPTATQRMKLPGQDTITALSPERADRLGRLYEEELVRRVRQNRPQARLWGGADDLLPDSNGETNEERKGASKGIAWGDFRSVEKSRVVRG